MGGIGQSRGFCHLDPRGRVADEVCSTVDLVYSLDGTETKKDRLRLLERFTWIVALRHEPFGTAIW